MIGKYIYTFALSFFLILSTKAAPNDDLAANDSIEISLLTCSPGSEIWAQYGHTAVRIHNLTTGTDIAINYGMFDMHQSYFILKFIFGITDYKMGVMPMDYFLAEYSYERRGVTEQVLNLSQKDKQAIINAFNKNLKPENVTYRYNYFYDNCTTRARDLIVKHLKRKVVYPKADKERSYREMIHDYNKNFLWSQFGEDLLLGINADKPQGQKEQQFLPNNLMNDFAKAKYNGQPFVKDTNILLPTSQPSNTAALSISPLMASILLLIVGILINIYEVKNKKISRIYDFCVILSAGIMGLIFFVMVFSSHPCVSLNGLLLAFNPLLLIGLYPVLKTKCALLFNKMWHIWTVLVLFCLAIGGIQHYPTPIIIVALLLLINCITHIYVAGKLKIK